MKRQLPRSAKKMKRIPKISPLQRLLLLLTCHSISALSLDNLACTASAIASITVSEISRLNFQELETPALASITDVKPLSFYNWIEEPNATPTIAVPGSPALWSALKVFLRLKKDSGLIYIAQNAARHPESFFKPLFRALYITHPLFDI